MLVLIIICLITINTVDAQSYTSSDVILNENIHSLFHNFFGDFTEFEYFAYSCNVGNNTRTCYFGIDKEFNYLKITYVDNNYNNNYRFETGIDENFNVVGFTYKSSIDPIYVLLSFLVFLSLTIFIFFLIVGW